MDAVRQDLVFAWRMLRRDRAYALAVILTLAMCLGANAAIVTVVRSVLLRPLPYPEPDRLIYSYDAFPGAGVERAGTSVPNYFDRRAMTDMCSKRSRSTSWPATTSVRAPTAEGVSAINVTPSFFQVLRTEAATGRLFREDEGKPGKNKVAVLSQRSPRNSPVASTAASAAQLRLERRAV